MRWTHIRPRAMGAEKPELLAEGAPIEIGCYPKLDRFKHLTGVLLEVMYSNEDGVRVMVDDSILCLPTSKVYIFDPECVPVWIPPFDNEDNIYYESEDPVWLNR